jgi:hypothetical protein
MHADAPVLSAYEIAEQAVTFLPSTGRHLECAAIEPSGEIILWSGDGQATQIPKHHQCALIGLMIQRRVNKAHLHALYRALLLASGDDALTLGEVYMLVTLALAKEDSFDLNTLPVTSDR